MPLMKYYSLLKSPSDDKDLEISDGGEEEQMRMTQWTWTIS